MMEEQLRARVAKSLKRKAVSDALWDELRALEYVEGVLSELRAERKGREEYSALLAEARRMVRVGRAEETRHRAVPGREAGVYAEAHYRPNERLRRDALSRYLVRVARADDDVQAFRRDVLDGRMLANDEALRFIQSPANAGKPTPKARNPPPVAGVLPYQHPRAAFVVHVPFWDGSVLHRLHDLGERLAQENRWGEDIATMFVLTDVTPMYDPAIATIHTYPRRVADTITLTVSPWLDAKTVAAIYRAAQREMIEGDNRGPGERALNLFMFVERHTRSDGTLDATWQTLMDLFNSEHPAVLPDRPYRHRGNFRARYNDALAMIRGYGLDSKAGTAR